MRVLITGGSGFIGSHLVQRFQGRAEIVVLDNLRTGRRSNLEGLDHTFVEGSVTDRSLVREVMHVVDFVFHLAALVSVPESMERPAECVDINIHGLLNVLQAAADEKVRKVVFASSAAVYGDNPEVPKHETMRPEPKSPYAITKLDGEYYLEMFRLHHGLDSASLRFFNVFGPRQDPDSAYAAAVPIFIQKALSGSDITIFGDGGQTRDFIHVSDIAAALEHCATRPDIHGTYNAGRGDSITILELAATIQRLTSSASVIRHLPERAGDIRHSRASIDKLLATGFQARTTLESGLLDTIRDGA